MPAKCPRRVANTLSAGSDLGAASFALFAKGADFLFSGLAVNSRHGDLYRLVTADAEFGHEAYAVEPVLDFGIAQNKKTPSSSQLEGVFNFVTAV